MDEQGNMKRVDFLKQLAQFLNSFSEENSSNTPDFILATFLDHCLSAWNDATRAREIWYGVKLAPGQSSTGEYKYGNAAGLEAKLLPGEPWFALRARDSLALSAVESYAKLCEDMGLAEHAAGVRRAIDQMHNWPVANADKVKLPD